jgi:N-acetylmuramoyl-L-alanine amidase
MRPAVIVFICLVGVYFQAMAAETSSCMVGIDIGHDRLASGATSARGRTEWSFNFDLATRLYDTMRSNGLNAYLINPSAAQIKLSDRPRIAENAGATLFIAIHHDSVQPQYMSQWEWDGHTRLYSDRFNGFGLFVSAKNPAFDESVKVADDIADGLLARGLRPSLHHAEPIKGENRPLLDAGRGIYQFDDLVVLKTANIPAVLIEAGIIVNREQELEVSTPGFQQKVVDAVMAAANSHCHRLR